ncbi:hypothetical protein CVT25_004519 [Psilocybe cyanescens]|uniref:Uncharacterized protein n=1 Tax=Psilocybe cyanescens TaxID=93625 RepID=A0A409XRV9_PSICY|nr:hypothetical protein CVT25_004519 [Psilocybe cyanescens]
MAKQALTLCSATQQIETENATVVPSILKVGGCNGEWFLSWGGGAGAQHYVGHGSPRATLSLVPGLRLPIESGHDPFCGIYLLGDYVLPNARSN